MDLHSGDSVVARVRETDRVLAWLAGGSEEQETDRVLATVQEFRESDVDDVRVPRSDIVAAAAATTVAEAIQLVAREGYSRYPVYRDSVDNVLGILDVFDLLGADPESRIESLVRPPLLTSATKSVGQLLREMQASYHQMAVVVDEFGGVAGLVTVDDLLEELVGDLHDESDEEEAQIRLLEPGAWWVDAATRVDDLNEALELALREGEYDTVAGLVLERLERIPHAGEKLRVGEVWLEVLTAEPHRIHAFKLTRAGSRPRSGSRDRNGERRK
jgi:CBS domain containing-hemolysin-like protein